MGQKQSSPNPDFQQHTKVGNSSIKGQLGTAGDNLNQNQVRGVGNHVIYLVIYLFGRRLRFQQEQNQKYQEKDVKILLARTKNYCESILDKELYTEFPSIEPDLEERLDLVNLPCSFETLDHSRKNLPSHEKVVDVFARIGPGRKLLIVGEPGSGKTTALLEIARAQIKYIEETQNYEQPIPVILDLSSWARERKLADWLIQKLSTPPYSINKRTSTALLEEHKLLLLLDGLDEVPAHRESCLESLREFIGQPGYGQTEIVICSHIQEYQKLIKCPSDRLSFQSAIEMKPLTRKKINEYLGNAGKKLEAVRELLTEDDTLYELVNTPLMLSVMSRALGKLDEKEQKVDLNKINFLEKPTERLFEYYIGRMFFRRREREDKRSSSSKSKRDQEHKSKHYQEDQAIRWLTWLAQIMQGQEYGSIFLIERMQPNLLQPGLQKNTYHFGVWLVSTLIVWLIIFIPAMMIGQQMNLLGDALLLGALTGLLRVSNERIEPIETFEFSWRNILKTLRSKPVQLLKVSIIIVMVDVILSGLAVLLTGARINYFSLILVLTAICITIIFLGIFSGMIYVLGVGLRGGNIPEDQRETPNLGIWQSLKNTFKFSLVGIVLYWIIFIPIGYLISRPLNGFAVGLVFGLSVGLFPGLGCVQHIMLRLILCFLSKSIPWNYAAFLDYAEKCIFLQKISGGYKYMHNKIRDHFAKRIMSYKIFVE